MVDPLRIEAGVREADEVVRTLRGGRRVCVEVEVLGSLEEVTLRYDGSTYYCETPTRLYRTPDSDEMRAHVEELGYAAGTTEA